MDKGITLKIKVDILDGEINIHVDKSGSINYISDDNKTNIIRKRVDPIYVPQNGDFVFFKSKTSTQFEDVSIFNKKVGDKYYTYFSVYKNDSISFNHMDDTNMHIIESQLLELRRANPEEIKFLLDKLKEENLSWNVETKTLSKIVEFEPKAGDLICVETKNYSDQVYVCKFNDLNTHTIFVDYTFSIKTSNLYEFKDKWVKSQFILRKPTSKELELFYNKLKEESLELDFENNLVEKPKVGDLCIFWDNNKSFAAIHVLEAINGPNPLYITNNDNYYKHCIKFNSEEQFKKLINEKV